MLNGPGPAPGRRNSRGGSASGTKIGSPGSLCRGMSIQPVMLAIIVFALMQQAIIFMSSRGSLPCPTLPPTTSNRAAMEDRGARGVLVGQSPTTAGAGANENIALPEKENKALAEAKKQISDMTNLANRNDKAAEINELAGMAKKGKDKFPHAGPNGCVSVREVSKHYCAHMGAERTQKCATKSTDCKHLYGCKVCKDGSAQMFPDDITNCMECKDGFALEDAGYSDCTGSCRPLDEGEEPPTTSTEPTTSTTAVSSKGEYAVPLDESGHPQSCKWLDFSEEDVAKWKAGNPLVVMVSTVVHKPGTEKQLLQDAAAVTWEALAPDVITVVAVDSDDQPSPENLPRIRCPTNAFGTPYVANLFGEAERLATATGATFAAYTNGDIALDDTLISVLDYVDRKRGKSGFPLGANGTKVAVLGKRLNIDSAIDNIDELIDLRKIENRNERREQMRNKLMRLSRKRRNIWMTDLAEDFFFYQPGAIDWSTVPNYVIGRVGWDSFLTQYLLDRPKEVVVLDASKMIHAAHLTGSDGNAAGWHTAKQDKQWNYCALQEACESSTDPQVERMCNDCFRCKLGGLHQTPYMLRWLESPASGEYYNYAVSPRVMIAETPTAIRQVTVGALLRNKIGLKHMKKFLTSIDPQKEECTPQQGEDGNFYEANCCSIMGSASIEYELGMRWQVRAEWPLGGWYKDW